jgi:hypothetical protein
LVEKKKGLQNWLIYYENKHAKNPAKRPKIKVQPLYFRHSIALNGFFFSLALNDFCHLKCYFNGFIKDCKWYDSSKFLTDRIVGSLGTKSGCYRILPKRN